LILSSIATFVACGDLDQDGGDGDDTDPTILGRYT
jgi:hypothetical protein